VVAQIPLEQLDDTPDTVPERCPESCQSATSGKAGSLKKGGTAHSGSLVSHLQAAPLTAHVIQSARFCLLCPAVRADRRLIPADRGDIVPPSPAMVPRSVLASSQERLGHRDRCLPLDDAHALGHGVLWGHREESGHVLRQQRPSSIRPSFGSANARTTSPRCRRRPWESA